MQDEREGYSFTLAPAPSVGRLITTIPSVRELIVIPLIADSGNCSFNLKLPVSSK